MRPNRVVALISGGMDSAVLAYHVKEIGYRVDFLSVNYGQRHVREIEAAADLAEVMGARHDVVDLSALRPLIAASALTGDTPVPHGHYTEESMRVTVVPNRNMMMIAIAAAVAASRGAVAVATAVHAGDHAIYPDCRPAFADAMRAALCKAMDGFWSVDLLTPFITISKVDIAKEGGRLGVPFNLTWSCYEGGTEHCGKCGTCVERREAFQLAGVADPTRYAELADA